MHTLKDAVAAMKCVFRQTDCCDVERRVHKALKRFEKAKPVEKGASCSLDTLSYEDSLIPLYRIQERISFTALRPTRIDLPEILADDLSDRDHDLETVVMLVNFGLSYFLLSTTLQDAVVIDKLRNNAQDIFNLASDVITNRFANCESDLEETHLMTVALLVTGNMIRVLQEQGESPDEHIARFQRLREAIEDSEIVDWYANEITAAAA